MEKNMQRQKDRRKSILLFLLLFFVLSLTSVVLGIVCLDGAQEGFFRKHFYLLAIVYAALMGLSYGLCVWVTLAGKKVAQKTAISVYVLLLIALVFCFLLQKTGFFEVVSSQEKLQAYLEKTGAWMPIIYVLLQFLQVVILPIPSLVTTLVGVPLFGALGATVYSLIGILLGSATAFFIGRKFGNRAAGWLVGEETLAKWQKKLKGKDNLFLTCAFVLPFFPDDILCLIAGMSTMPTRYFFIVILLSRAIGIIATCYSIDFIPLDTWWGITIWCAFLVLVLGGFIFIYKNMDKLQAKIKKIRNHKKDECKKE